MDKIETFLKFTLPTVVLSSLSYEICYLWGLDINIAHTPLSNGDILRGWQQWYIFLIPLLFITLFPNSIIRVWNFIKKRPRKGSVKHINNERLASILLVTLTIFATILFAMFLLFGDQLIAFLILSFSIFSFRFLASLSKNRIINGRFLMFISMICLFSSIIGSYASLFAKLDYYNSLFDEKTYVEVNETKKNVIRVYENWTLVRNGFESYAWLHHQSERKIIYNVDRLHFLGIACFAQRQSFINNSFSRFMCDAYEKIEVLEDGEDENCLIDAYKKPKSMRKDELNKCFSKS